MEQGKLKFGTDGDRFCWIWDIWYWLRLRSALQGFFISFHTIPYKVVSLFLHNGVFSVTRTLLPDWEQEPTVITHALAQKCRSCEHRLQVFVYIISKCTTAEHTWAWLSACFQRRCCVSLRYEISVWWCESKQGWLHSRIFSRTNSGMLLNPQLYKQKQGRKVFCVSQLLWLCYILSHFTQMFLQA